MRIQAFAYLLVGLIAQVLAWGTFTDAIYFLLASASQKRSWWPQSPEQWLTPTTPERVHPWKQPTKVMVSRWTALMPPIWRSAIRA